MVCLAHKDNRPLIQLINEGIAELKANGVIDEIIRRYSQFEEGESAESRMKMFKSQ